MNRTKLLIIFVVAAVLAIPGSAALIEAFPDNPSDGDDYILGTDIKDTINAKNGDDQVWGLGGNDKIRGQNGDDHIVGGEGNDNLQGNDDADHIDGGPGSDKIRGNNGPDTISGGPGADDIKGGNSNDVISGGDDDDDIHGNGGADHLYGDGGDDHLDGDNGNDTIDGGIGNDHLDGKKGNDLVFGNEGDDRVHGDDGNDTLFGGEGNDEIEGRNGDDFLFGGPGNDNMTGGPGVDFLDGGPGDDDLSGGSSSDGDTDTLDGGPGIDTCRGIDGEDIFVDCEIILDEDTGEPIGPVTPIAPVADDQSVFVPEGTPTTITLTGSDANGDTLTFSLDSGPIGSSTVVGLPAMDLSMVGVTYTPDPTLVDGDSDSFDFKVDDGNGGTNTATVDITITGVNAVPVADTQAVGLDEDTSIEITLMGSDADLDALTFTIDSDPSDGSLGAISVLTPTSANVTYTPDQDFFGGDSFVFKVDDLKGGTDTATVDITVTAVNDDPVANDQAVNVIEETITELTLDVSDVDAGDTLSFTVNSFSFELSSVTISPAGVATIDPGTQSPITGLTFEYTVEDGNGGMDTAIVTVDIVAAPLLGEFAELYTDEDFTVKVLTVPPIPGTATIFAPGDEFCMILSSDVVNTASIKKAEYELKINGVKMKKPLDNNGDGTFSRCISDDGFSLSGFAGGSGTLKVKAEDTTKTKTEFKNILIEISS